MAKVHITNIVVLDNPSSFLNPFQFELTFECIEELKEDLEWKMIYVGSAESEEYDQVLDTIYVGPVPEGRHIFVFQADPPDVTRIPEQDVLGVTIVLLTCSYRGQEFVRVGYFINNDYADPELKEMPPVRPQFDKLSRNILASKPRVTRFKINWDDTTNGATNNDGMDSDASAIGYFQSEQNNIGENSVDQQQSFEMAHASSSTNGGGSGMMMTNDSRLNENSNSLAMEC